MTNYKTARNVRMLKMSEWLLHQQTFQAGSRILKHFNLPVILPCIQHYCFHYLFRALHPLTGRVLEVYSNQPGMQFYTGNLLPDPDKIVEVSPMTNTIARKSSFKLKYHLSQVGMLLKGLSHKVYVVRLALFTPNIWSIAHIMHMLR